MFLFHIFVQAKQENGTTSKKTNFFISDFTTRSTILPPQSYDFDSSNTDLLTSPAATISHSNRHQTILSGTYTNCTEYLLFPEQEQYSKTSPTLRHSACSYASNSACENFSCGGKNRLCRGDDKIAGIAKLTSNFSKISIT
jgi:hypothetical protein